MQVYVSLDLVLRFISVYLYSVCINQLMLFPAIMQLKAYVSQCPIEVKTVDSAKWAEYYRVLCASFPSENGEK